MVDLHCHILPGLDDGVRTLEEAIDLARTAKADGITTIAATPHVRDDFPTRAEDMEAGVTELNDVVRAAGIGVEILTGGELALDFLQDLPEGEVRRFGLGGNADVLLLEFPYHGWPLGLEELVFRLRAREITPLIAHPERNPAAFESTDRLWRLCAGGAYLQVTAASLDGRLGARTRRVAKRLVELELVHVIGTDAHHRGIRTTGMRAARAAVGDDALGRWLTEDVPRALVAGDEPPPRPARRRSRLRRR